MKYNRMLCLINKDENWGERLKILASNQFPLIFANSSSEFESQINKNDYIIVSILMAKDHLNELKDLLKNYCQITFHFLGHLAEDGYTPNEFEILDEENAVSIPYDPEELVLEYTGKIENIFSFRGIPDRRH